MTRSDLLAVCAAAVVTWLGTGVLIAVGNRIGLVDVPNARSSHSRPTARGGGVAIVLGWLAALLLVADFDEYSRQFAISFVPSMLAVALIGLLDDLFSLAARIRLCVHFAAVGWTLSMLPELPSIALPVGELEAGAAVWIMLLFAVVWLINLYNFMDGIDGIAAAETVFVLGGGALLCVLNGQQSDWLITLLIAGAVASLAFAAWNWAPARIFMGDVGSGALGAGIGIVALYAAKATAVSIWCWLILLGAFVVDSTTTLMRRAWRGERVYAAHRTHAYQWLARRWSSHSHVVSAMTALNIVWLLPWAYVASRANQYGALFAVIALGPLVFIAHWAGSGNPEVEESAS